jgi:hypothetical protein
VRHWVPAERMRVSTYLWWFFWSGITFAALDATPSRSGRSLLGVPLYLVRRAALAAEARSGGGHCGQWHSCDRARHRRRVRRGLRRVAGDLPARDLRRWQRGTSQASRCSSARAVPGC